MKNIKEEPKQEGCCTPIGQIKRYVDCKGCDEKPEQDPIEEASWKYNPLRKLDGEFIRAAFVAGAKHQAEKMYSEEDMIEFAVWVYLEVGQNSGKERTNKELFKEWLNKFKKQQL
jgi:hypothetical protein